MLYRMLMTHLAIPIRITPRAERSPIIRARWRARRGRMNNRKRSLTVQAKERVMNGKSILLLAVKNFHDTRRYVTSVSQWRRIFLVGGPAPFCPKSSLIIMCVMVQDHTPAR